MRHNPRSLYSTPSEQFYTLIVKLKGKYITIWDITPAHIIPHREKILQSNRQTKGEIYTHMRHNPRSLYTPSEQFYTLIVKLKGKCIPIWDITPAHIIPHREKVLQSNRQTKGEIYTHMRHIPRSLYTTPWEQFYNLIVKLKGKSIHIWDITPLTLYHTVRTVLKSNRQTKGKIYTHMRHNPRSLYTTPLEQFYNLIVKLKGKSIPIWDITPAHFIVRGENSSTI